MSNAPGIIVVGLGAHGSALVHELARRGISVLGVDALTPPHGSGSTTGRTRITREAYYEHPLYVPLVQRAHDFWDELEELTGTVLLRRTGALMCGRPGSVLIEGTLASCREHSLEHEILDQAAIRARFPALHPPDGFIGILEQAAGVLLVEACLRTFHELAIGYGASLLMDTRVTGWQADSGGVTLITDRGELRAPRVVFAPGPWLNDLLARERTSHPLQLDLQVTRQTSHWYQPAPGNHSLRADACPVTMIERADGVMLYTLPDIGHGMKAGIHHDGDVTDAGRVERTISMREEQRMRALVEDWMPGATHRELDAAVCLYTNTPDGHFALGAHPRHDNVMLVSACSGHGFKFCPVLAELLADALLDDAELPEAFDVRRIAGDQLSSRFSSQG